jgi:hypothetical protein
MQLPMSGYEAPLATTCPLLVRSRHEADREDASDERVGIELMLEPELRREEVTEDLGDEARRGRGKRLTARGNEGLEQLRHLRLKRVAGIPRVPDQSEPTARPEDTADLPDGLVPPEPVERLPAHDRVDAVVVERNRLGRAEQRVRAGDNARQRSQHLRAGLDRDDPRNPPDEQPGQLARPRTEIEHRRADADVEPIDEPVDRLVGI